jgi:hypothetical protein
MSFFAPLKSISGNFYDITWHSNYCDTPALIKFSDEGEESYYQDVFPEACPGGHGEMNILNDTTFVVLVGGEVNNNQICKWIKIDTLGIIKFEKAFTEEWISGATTLSIISSYLKITSLSKVGLTSYFYRLKDDFNFDDLDTSVYIYDSLCPYPIESDYFDPDCGLIVTIEDPHAESGAYSLSVYPNPATDKLTVVIPEYLQKQSGMAGFSANTVYHKWGAATLEAYDLSGKKVSERLIRQGAGFVELDVREWQPGLYMFRLVFQNQTVAEEKVMVKP